jgi:anti-anti-sigma factor
MDELTEMPRARLAVSTDPADGPNLVVRLAGNLDLAGLTDITEQVEELLARDPQPLVVDLADVAFIDSSGVGLLIRLAHRFGPMRARAASPSVRRVIKVLGLVDLLGLDEA